MVTRNIGDYYHFRWEIFFEEARLALVLGVPFDETNFDNLIRDWEEVWEGNVVAKKHSGGQKVEKSYVAKLLIQLHGDQLQTFGKRLKLHQQQNLFSLVLLANTKVFLVINVHRAGFPLPFQKIQWVHPFFIGRFLCHLDMQLAM